MDNRTRLPGDLAWILLWCLLTAGFLLFLGYHATGPFKPFLLGVGGFVLLLTGALYRLHGWARWAGALLFAVLAAIRFIAIFRSGFTLGRLGMGGIMAWWACYLMLPSTKKLFQNARGVRIDAASGVVFVSIFALTVAGIFGMIALKVPMWVAIVVLIAASIVYVFFEERIRRRVNAWFSLRPADLDRASWKVFRDARRARAGGDLATAEALAAGLPATRSADLFRAVLAMDRARRETSLRRIVYDASWTPSVYEHPRILEEVATADLVALVNERARLIDALFADAAEKRPAMAEELEPLMEVLTSLIFLQNAENQLREWWSAARGRCTGGKEHVWLVSRLWEAQCIQAAEDVARKSGDAMLAEAAAFAWVLEQARRGDQVAPDWIPSHAGELALLPSLCDLLGVLYLEQPGVTDRWPAWAADRVRMRAALVGYLRQFRDDYAENSVIEPPWLLSQLTGSRLRIFRSRARFEAWWSQHADGQARHDEAFAAGFEAAGRDAWEEAERAFGRAAEAWPERATAEYNRAIALLQLERYADAEKIFLKRAQAEPGEPLFWVRAGDCRRLDGRGREAVEAYEKARELGGPAGALTARIGLTLATEQEDERAGDELDKAIGEKPDAATLDSVARTLESEGAYKLAMKYQERAFYESLGSKDGGDGDDEEAEPAGA